MHESIGKALAIRTVARAGRDALLREFYFSAGDMLAITAALISRYFEVMLHPPEPPKGMEPESIDYHLWRGMHRLANYPGEGSGLSQALEYFAVRLLALYADLLGNQGEKIIDPTTLRRDLGLTLFPWDPLTADRWIRDVLASVRAMQIPHQGRDHLRHEEYLREDCVENIFFVMCAVLPLCEDQTGFATEALRLWVETDGHGTIFPLHHAIENEAVGSTVKAAFLSARESVPDLPCKVRFNDLVEGRGLRAA